MNVVINKSESLDKLRGSRRSGRGDERKQGYDRTEDYSSDVVDSREGLRDMRVEDVPLHIDVSPETRCLLRRNHSLLYLILKYHSFESFIFVSWNFLLLVVKSCLSSLSLNHSRFRLNIWG